jgi:hypothetical protein
MIVELKSGGKKFGVNIFGGLQFFGGQHFFGVKNLEGSTILVVQTFSGFNNFGGSSFFGAQTWERCPLGVRHNSESLVSPVRSYHV